MARHAPGAARNPDSERRVSSGSHRVHERGPTAATTQLSGVIETDIPARLDALPFGRFHLLVIVALGVTWVLDGLEVTLAGSLSGELVQHTGLGLSNAQIGLAGSAYLLGAVLGAFGFGWLSDRLGRKKLFFITLAVYLLATAATGLSWNASSYLLFRLLTGAGIGGEYTAINSTIQELIPARLRGWTDLLINGSFWIGAAMGAGGSILLLNPAFIDPALGWRLAFLIGTAIGLIILLMRRWIPESPRWLMTHGFAKEADAIVCQIESRFGDKREMPPRRQPPVRLRMRDHTPLAEVARVLFKTYRRRTFVGLMLMAAQAFFYNAIFFTYALILTNFYAIPAGRIGWYILPFAAGNVLGPLLLGRLFDTVGRKIMIASTYAASAVLLAIVGYLFEPKSFHRANIDRRMDDRVFLRLGSRKLGLSHGKRNLSVGNPRARDCLLLRDRHRNRRGRRTVAIGLADRYRIARQRRHRLRDRIGADACRRRSRGIVGCCRRTQIAGISRAAAVVYRSVMG